MSYRRQAVRGWGCWRQESRRTGRGRSKRRRTVEDEVFIVSIQNRCVILIVWSLGIIRETDKNLIEKEMRCSVTVVITLK